jgi:biotin transport system substrate-specific component
MNAMYTTPSVVAHSAARQAPSFALLAAGVIGFALLTALGAHAAWPAPGSPVPYTLQSLVVMIAAMLLGPRLGMLSMLFYVALGTAGYHVFATGNFGLRTIFGPTGGYLLGFILAQPIIGLLSRPGRGLWLRLPAGLLAGNAVLFACGLAWLHVWTTSLAGSSWSATLSLGLLPFLPDLAVKMAIAYALGLALVPTLRPVFDRA